MNCIVLVGRIGRDPELKTTSSGKTFCTFSVAVPKRIKPTNGDPDADWFNVNRFKKGKISRRSAPCLHQNVPLTNSDIGVSNMANINIPSNRRRDLSGQKFGRLTAVELSGSRNGKSLWLCQCECGNSKITMAESLLSGACQSCGCLRKQMSSQRRTTHGLSQSPEYNIWQNMHRRCGDVSHRAYWRYGGRGISVCSRWGSFQSFYDDMGPRPDSLTLERIDNNKGYSPDNCRWATRKDQIRNRENTLVVSYKGSTIPVAELADYLKVNYFTLLDRLNVAVGKVSEVAA